MQTKTGLIKIGERIIGPGHPCFIIAEAGGNANSDLEVALQLVREASKAGAHSIKFQTYKAETIVTKNAKKYWVDTMDEWEQDKEPQGCQIEEFELLDGLSFDDYRIIKDECDRLGIVFFSTPFDFQAVDMLDELGMEVYKVASADITYHGLLERIALKGKPIFLSTGASNMEEVREAVKVIQTTGNRQIGLMQCTLHYPSRFEEFSSR